MIFTAYKDKLFFIDILFHMLFSFTVLVILYITRLRKIRNQEFVKKVKEVLKESDVFLEISPTKEEDKLALKILDNIYENQKYSDSVKNNDLKKASYNQIIIFASALFVVIFFVEDKKSIIKLFLEKLITFGILGSTLFLYNYYFKGKYSDISRKYIYDSLKESNKKLTTSTNY